MTTAASLTGAGGCARTPVQVQHVPPQEQTHLCTGRGEMRAKGHSPEVPLCSTQPCLLLAGGTHRQPAPTDSRPNWALLLRHHFIHFLQQVVPTREHCDTPSAAPVTAALAVCSAKSPGTEEFNLGLAPRVPPPQRERQQCPRCGIPDLPAEQIFRVYQRSSC